MRLSIALLGAAVAVTSAQPQHGHHKRFHHQKRDPVPNAAPDYADLPGPVQVVYVLNGKPIPEDEVQQGIQNGTLIVATDGEISSAPGTGNNDNNAPPAAPPAAPAYAPPSTSSAPQPSSTSAYVPPPPLTTTAVASSSQAPPPPTTTTAAAPPPSHSGGSSSGTGNGATGVDTDFPDGELSCDTFPSDYGAVPVEWLGLDGWTGVQCPESTDGGYGNIRTVSSGGKCEEGAFCSYACPAGYQKSQWPTTQGSTGQSIGGIQCKNGKLHLTNPDLSSKLCMKGSDKVQVLVQNTLSQNVAVCRTDYPGTESETIPVNVEPGQTTNLTCPDADNYYHWQGGKTSAQYYVNPAGVSVEDACQWGDSSQPRGNYAPMNLGVGYSNGAAWLSIFQNAPTTDAKLDFCVEIQGDGIIGKCKYSNGQYCGGADGTTCSSTTGCTVSKSDRCLSLYIC
jgi:hypothetical protein